MTSERARLTCRPAAVWYSTPVARPCSIRTRFRGTPAPLVACGGLVVAATLLLSAVEVGVFRDARLYAGLKHGFRQFAFLCLVGDVQRATGAVECVGAASLVLGFLEVRQHGIPVPADAAALTPLVVVAVVATDIQHAVDRAGPAERLAAREVEAAIGHLWLRFGFKLPVHQRIDIGFGVAERDVDPGVFVGRSGLQQQHVVTSGFGEAAGDGAARRPGAGDDEVVGVRHGLGSPSVWLVAGLFMRGPVAMSWVPVTGGRDRLTAYRYAV